MKKLPFILKIRILDSFITSINPIKLEFNL